MPPQNIDTLLVNGLLVTMDDQRTIHPAGAVAIKDDHIVAVGPTDQLKETYRAKTVLDCTDCIISPGLVNAHTHVPMTLLRGLADDLRLDV